MIRCEELTTEAFAPFGQVIETPAGPGRAYFSEALESGRPGARPSLSMAYRAPSPLPLTATTMERHQYSSQSFVATDVSRWLVLVAPHAATGGPDMSRARAFLPKPGQGITFGADVWHHPLTVFDRPGTFALFMWLDGSKTDEEFFTLPTPMLVEIDIR
ncbi:MAG: ureidoglycolate lyase [Hyphomicrobiaceae bacterium]